MLNPKGFQWPQIAANSSEANTSTDPWGLGAAFETQARLWNHFLDANRSFWEFYAPWLQAGPWLFGATAAQLEREEAGEEPAQTADGIPDALESQTRSWNHFLDAHRNFWTAANWPTPAFAPWMPQAADDYARNAAEVIDNARASSARAKPARKAAKTTRARSR